LCHGDGNELNKSYYPHSQQRSNKLPNGWQEFFTVVFPCEKLDLILLTRNLESMLTVKAWKKSLKGLVLSL
jgi:hypothetical protein